MMKLFLRSLVSKKKLVDLSANAGFEQNVNGGILETRQSGKTNPFKFFILLFAFVMLWGMVSSQPSNYSWDRFGLGTLTMTNNSPVNGIISNTTLATGSSTYYLVQWDDYANKWSNTSTPYNQEFTLTWGGGSFNGLNGVLNTATSNGKYYTMQIEGLSYSSRQAVLMETDNTPQSFHATPSTAVSTPSLIAPGQNASINITLAGSKSSQERVFVRYSTDNWSTSKVSEAIGSGGTWSTASATISGSDNNSGTTVRYYAYSTTVSATNSSKHDLITLRLANNSGSNYSYTVQSSWTTKSGASTWSDPNSWDAGEVPVSDKPVIIEDDLTLDQNASVSSLTINSGKTFAASDAYPRTLTITKSTSGTSTTLSNSGTWAHGSGVSTVVFTGAPSSGDATHITSGSFGFNNVTVNKTGGSKNVGINFGDNSTISGTLEIGGGGFVANTYPTSFFQTNSNLQFNTSGIYDVYDVDKTWPKAGSMPPSIEIKSGTVNLHDLRAATGNLLIDGGTLALSAGLTIQGNWTRSSGTFTPNEQTVTLSGTTNTIISTSTEATLYDLVVSKTGGAYVSLSSNLTVSHNMTISSGIFNIPSGKALTVSGTLTNSAGASGLVIKSDATGTGSLKTSGTVSGNITVERYITAGTSSSTDKIYHIVSAPVSGQAVTLFTGISDIYGFFRYDEATNYWINSNSSSPPFGADFVVGRGYMANFKTAQTPSFAGALQSGTITFGSGGAHEFTFTTESTGWNLIGNPYPSAIDWNAGTGWTKTNIDNALYYRDGGNWVTYIDGVPADQNRNIIPVGQGVFVHANAASPGLAMTNDVRVHSSVAYHKDVTVLENLIDIAASGNECTDHAYIHFRDQATTDFDSQFDAFKMFSDNDYYPQVFTLASDNTELSIDKREVIQTNTSVPVCFKSGLNGDYSLSFTGLDSFTPNVKFLLEDKLLNKITDLRQQSLVQIAYTTGDDSQRFILHLEGMVGINDPETNQQVSIYAFGDKLYLDSKKITGQVNVEVFNLTGQKLSGRSYSSAQSLTIPLQGAQGFYIVRVTGTDFITSQKVYIR